MGYGYDVTAMDESRDLTRADLDAHFPDNPDSADARLAARSRAQYRRV